MMLLSTPCMRSHELSRFEHAINLNSMISTTVTKKSIGCVAKPEEGNVEIYKLVKNMPILVIEPHSDAFNLHVSSDVDLESAALETSWFVNIVVSFLDRNGTVIYHEAHFPKNPSLAKGVTNFVDTRWSDNIHHLDTDVWNQHLTDSFNEADRWQSVRLSETDSLKESSTEAGGRKLRQCSSASNNHQVSTTTRLSPESNAGSRDARRHFVVCPIYRARWGSGNIYYYFKTISLPFLRNQTATTSIFDLDLFDENGGDSETVFSSTGLQESSEIGMFSPTSSFENLLLLNYHCILGKCPLDSINDHLSSIPIPTFNPATLCVSKYGSKSQTYPPEFQNHCNRGTLKRCYSFTRLNPSPLEPTHISSTCSSPWRLGDVQSAEQQQEGMNYPPDTSIYSKLPQSVDSQSTVNHVIHYRADVTDSVSSSSSPSQNQCYHNNQHQDHYQQLQQRTNYTGGYSNYPSDADHMAVSPPLEIFERYHAKDPFHHPTPVYQSPQLLPSGEQPPHLHVQTSAQPPSIDCSVSSSYINSHLTPVEIDWIDQSNNNNNSSSSNLEYHHEPKFYQTQLPQLQHSEYQNRNVEQLDHNQSRPRITQTPSGQKFASDANSMPQLLLAVTDAKPENHNLQHHSVNDALHRTDMLDSKAQSDRVSLLLSLLPKEAIHQIREAFTKDSNMALVSNCEQQSAPGSITQSAPVSPSLKNPLAVKAFGQQVRAIILRFLGPDMLSTFFSPNAVSQVGTSGLPPGYLSSSSSSSSSCRSRQLSATSSVSKTSHTYRPPTLCLPDLQPPGGGKLSCQVTPSSSSSLASTPVCLLKESLTSSASRVSQRPSLVSERTVPPIPTLCTPTGMSLAESTFSVYDLDAIAPSSQSSLAGGAKETPLAVCPQKPPNSSTSTSSFLPSRNSSGTTTPASFESVATSCWTSRMERQSLSSNDLAGRTSGVLESLLSGDVDFMNGSILTPKYPPSIRHRNISETSGMNCAKRQPLWPSSATNGSTSKGVSELPRPLHKSSNSISKSRFFFDFSASEPHSPYQSSGTGIGRGAGWSHNHNPLEPPSPPLTSPRDNTRLLAHLLTPISKESTNIAPLKSEVPMPSVNTCSSLAHLLVHGVTPSPTSTRPVLPEKDTYVNAEVFFAASSSSPSGYSDSSQIPTATSARAKRIFDNSSRDPTAGALTSRQRLDTLSIVVEPPPADLSAETKIYKVNNSELNMFTPLLQPAKCELEMSTNSIKFEKRQLQVNSDVMKKIPSTTNATSPPSSLCRLLMGDGPKWETVSAEVESAKAHGFVTAPPPSDAVGFKPATQSRTVLTSLAADEVTACGISQTPPLSVNSSGTDGIKPAGDDDLWELFDNPDMASFLIGFDNDTFSPGTSQSTLKDERDGLTGNLEAVSRVKRPRLNSTTGYSNTFQQQQNRWGASCSTNSGEPRQLLPKPSQPQQLQMEKFEPIVGPLLPHNAAPQPPSSTPLSAAAPPSNAMANTPSFSPAKERNLSAAVAAAKVAQEAANQRYIMQGQRELTEKKRLLHQQKLCRIESVSERAVQNVYNSSRSLSVYPRPPGSMMDPAPFPISLEDFSRRLKEVAPNISVQHANNNIRTGFPSPHPQGYRHSSGPPNKQHDSQVSLSGFDQSSHLAPVSYDYHENINHNPSTSASFSYHVDSQQSPTYESFDNHFPHQSRPPLRFASPNISRIPPLQSRSQPLKSTREDSSPDGYQNVLSTTVRPFADHHVVSSCSHPVSSVHRPSTIKNNVKAELRLIVTNRCQATEVSLSSQQQHNNNQVTISSKHPHIHQKTQLMSAPPIRPSSSLLMHSPPATSKPTAFKSSFTSSLQQRESRCGVSEFIAPPTPQTYSRNGHSVDVARHLPPRLHTLPAPLYTEGEGGLFPTPNHGGEEDTHMPEDVVDYVLENLTDLG